MKLSDAVRTGRQERRTPSGPGPTPADTVTILGRSPATLAMLIESLRAGADRAGTLTVRIIYNLSPEDTLEFGAPGVTILEDDHESWARDGRPGLKAGVHERLIAIKR